MDYIKLLNSRGVLHARKGDWRQAERDLREAVSIVDSEKRVDPGVSAPLLENYALVLHKNRRRREAQVVEARLKAYQSESIQEALVVDVYELRGRGAGK
jgi:hypothetical protein